MKKTKRFWMTREDYERAYDHCDLGDSCGIRVYFWPHKDMIPDLIECQPVIESDSGIESDEKGKEND